VIHETSGLEIQKNLLGRRRQFEEIDNMVGVEKGMVNFVNL